MNTLYTKHLPFSALNIIWLTLLSTLIYKQYKKCSWDTSVDNKLHISEQFQLQKKCFYHAIVHFYKNIQGVAICLDFGIQYKCAFSAFFMVKRCCLCESLFEKKKKFLFRRTCVSFLYILLWLCHDLLYLLLFIWHYLYLKQIRFYLCFSSFQIHRPLPNTQYYLLI